MSWALLLTSVTELKMQMEYLEVTEEMLLKSMPHALGHLKLFWLWPSVQIYSGCQGVCRFWMAFEQLLGLSPMIFYWLRWTPV